MGYRSSVALVLYKSDYEELLKQAQPLIAKGWCGLLDEKPKREWEQDGKTYICLAEDWIKWYDEFDEVMLVHKFIENKPHAFARVGEEYDDILFEYDAGIEDDDVFYEALSIHRDIALNIPGEVAYYVGENL